MILHRSDNFGTTITENHYSKEHTCILHLFLGLLFCVDSDKERTNTHRNKSTAAYHNGTQNNSHYPFTPPRPQVPLQPLIAASKAVGDPSHRAHPSHPENTRQKHNETWIVPNKQLQVPSRCSENTEHQGWSDTRWYQFLPSECGVVKTDKAGKEQPRRRESGQRNPDQTKGRIKVVV